MPPFKPCGTCTDIVCIDTTCRMHVVFSLSSSLPCTVLTAVVSTVLGDGGGDSGGWIKHRTAPATTSRLHTTMNPIFSQTERFVAASDAANERRVLEFGQLRTFSGAWELASPVVEPAWRFGLRGLRLLVDERGRRGLVIGDVPAMEDMPADQSSKLGSFSEPPEKTRNWCLARHPTGEKKGIC